MWYAAQLAHLLSEGSGDLSSPEIQEITTHWQLPILLSSLRQSRAPVKSPKAGLWTSSYSKQPLAHSSPFFSFPFSLGWKETIPGFGIWKDTSNCQLDTSTWISPIKDIKHELMILPYLALKQSSSTWSVPLSLDGNGIFFSPFSFTGTPHPVHQQTLPVHHQNIPRLSALHSTSIISHQESCCSLLTGPCVSALVLRPVTWWANWHRSWRLSTQTFQWCLVAAGVKANVLTVTERALHTLTPSASL